MTTTARPEFVIATMPRSGSNLLCDFLRRNGIGQPFEHLNPEMGPVVKARSEGQTVEQFIAAQRAWHEERGVMFGTKVHGQWLTQICPVAERGGRSCEQYFRDLFPAAKFILLTREDLLAQAISFRKAIRTGHWAKRDGQATAEPAIEIRPREVHAALVWLLYHESRWRTFFAEQNIEPLTLTYERLIEHKEESVRSIMRFLEIEEPAEIRSDSDHEIMRDERTARIRQAYLESGNLQAMIERLSVSVNDNANAAAGDGES